WGGEVRGSDLRFSRWVWFKCDRRRSTEAPRRAKVRGSTLEIATSAQRGTIVDRRGRSQGRAECGLRRSPTAPRRDRPRASTFDGGTWPSLLAMSSADKATVLAQGDGVDRRRSHLA
ncbi:MAG: hypothetical protein WCI05_15735, partial [Myxococcales bacterium]